MRPADALRSRTFGIFLSRVEGTKIFPPARIKEQPCLAYTNCYTLLRNGVFTYVKKCFAGSLEIGQCSSAAPHRNFLPGSWGDSCSRGPKQANRSSETARNFLRSAFRLLRFFPQGEYLKTSFLNSIDTIIAIKTKYCSSGAILFSAITSLRLSGHAPAHAKFHPVTNKGTNLFCKN